MQKTFAIELGAKIKHMHSQLTLFKSTHTQQVSFILLVLLCLLSTSIAFAKNRKHCKRLYRQKHYTQAGHCYQDLRTRKPADYCNEGRAWEKSAQKQEQSVQLERYRKSAKSYQECSLVYPIQRAAVERRLNKLLKKIVKIQKRLEQQNKQKIQKTLVTLSFRWKQEPQKGSVLFRLKGSSTIQRGELPFQGSLPLGIYSIEIKHPKAQTIQAQFEVSKEQRKHLFTLSLKAIALPTPPSLTKQLPPQQQENVWTTRLGIGGGALLLTGGVLIGLSIYNQMLLDSPNRDGLTALEANELRNTQRWESPTGWTFAGLGLVAVGGAFVFKLLEHNKQKGGKSSAATSE